MFIIDYKSRVPIYEQLKTQTIERIIAQILQPGDQLPSVRVLARELSVNPNTIQKAYQDMEREGLIYTVTGKGSFVAAKEITSLVAIRAASERLYTAAKEARIYGVTLQQAIEEVKRAYGEESSDD